MEISKTRDAFIFRAPQPALVAFQACTKVKYKRCDQPERTNSLRPGGSHSC
jgi:hypothetical protein